MSGSGKAGCCRQVAAYTVTTTDRLKCTPNVWARQGCCRQVAAYTVTTTDRLKCTPNVWAK